MAALRIGAEVPVHERASGEDCGGRVFVQSLSQVLRTDAVQPIKLIEGNQHGAPVEKNAGGKSRAERVARIQQQVSCKCADETVSTGGAQAIPEPVRLLGHGYCGPASLAGARRDDEEAVAEAHDG